MMLFSHTFQLRLNNVKALWCLLSVLAGQNGADKSSTLD